MAKKLIIYDARGNEVLTKAAQVPDLDPSFWTSAGNSTDNNVSDIARKPYINHWLVYAAARNISSNLARLPRRFKREDESIVEKNHDLLKLFRRPNVFMTGRTFWEAVVLYTLLPAEGMGASRGGQCFIVCDSGNEDPRVDLAKGEIPASMYPYSDEFITAQYDSKRKFVGWKLKIENELEVEYAPHQIIRVYNFNPYDWLSGVSMCAPAILSLKQDIKANIWNTRSFENDAIPAGVLSSEQELDETQAAEIKARWYQQYSGVGNARRVAVLGKGTQFQTTGITQKDLEFSQQKDRAVDEMLAAFGLNKIAIGKYEQINYATIIEGHRMLWEDTYMPIDDSICEQVNSQFVNNVEVKNKIYISADTSSVRVLKKDYTKNIASAKTMYDMKVPASVAMRINEVPITDQDIKDCPWLAEKPEPVSMPAYGYDALADSGMEYDAPKKSVIIKTGFGLDARDKISMDYIERVLQPGENLFFSKLLRYFTSERNRMLDKVDEWYKATSKKYKEVVDGVVVSPSMFLLDLDEETQFLIERIYRPQVVLQLRAEYAKLNEELGRLVDWGIKDETIDRFINNRRAALMSVVETTFSAVSDKVSDAIADGYSRNLAIDELSREIKDAISDVGEIRKNQSRTIARTETGIISSEARYDAFKDAEVEYHQWINAHDEKVRDTHADGSGDGGLIVRVGTEFPNTRLLHPLDPSGEPGEIINCRCTSVAVEKP